MGRGRQEFAQQQRVFRIILDQQGMDVGWNHGLDVCAHLQEVAANVKLLDLGAAWPNCPPTADISDWIDAGGTIEALYFLAAAAPDFSPDILPALPVELIPVIEAFPIEGCRLPRRPSPEWTQLEWRPQRDSPGCTSRGR